MAARNVRLMQHMNVSSLSPHQNNQIRLTKPLCILVIILIICNMVTLHFLNKSVQRTTSMNCLDVNMMDRDNLNINALEQHSQKSKRYKFKNLLDINSPYSHLPYLPHNLKDHMNTNPNNLNDPSFIEAIKERNNNKQSMVSINDNNNNDIDIKSEENDENIYRKYQISQQILRPKKSITIQDEIDRNGIIENEQLWNIEIEQDSDDIICDDTMEYLFNATIHTLHKLKGRNYMESMICPNIAKLGWRHSSYVPFIFGNHCEPWWSRDAVFIISRIINKNMFGVEWGTGVSSLWLSMLSNFTIAMEHDKVWQFGVENITQKLNINNLLVLQEHLGRRYCELDYSSSFDNDPGGHKWKKGSIDFFSIDGRLRYPVTQWMLNWIKPHGGIIIFDNSDRIETDNKYGQHNATNLIPSHWLRFDSNHFKQHIKPIQDKRWLKNSMTTIWITRHKKCAKGRFDLNGPPIKNKKNINKINHQQLNHDDNDDDDVNEPQLNFRPF